MRGKYLYRGGRMCFPVRDCRCLLVSHSISPRFCPVVPRSRSALGRPDVFSRSRLRTTSSPLRDSPTLLMPTSSRRPSMVRMDTFRGGSSGRSVRSSNVVQWMQAHWFVPSCILALDHKRPFKPPRVSTLHAWVFVFFMKLEIRGGAENLSPARRQVPL